MGARKEVHRVRIRESPQSSRSPSVSSLSPNVSPFPKAVLKNRGIDKRMSQQFLLQRLVTPPRPTPSRRRMNSHRTSSHKKGRKARMSSEGPIVCDLDDDNKSDSDSESEEPLRGMAALDAMEEGDRRYMVDCCDIIASYVRQFTEIIEGKLSESGHFIRMLLFSLPVLVHEYAPNAITVNEVLLISHEWYRIKFMWDADKTGIRKFSKKGELHYIQRTLAHLQAKVLSKTYSNSNFAEIWKQKGIEADDI